MTTLLMRLTGPLQSWGTQSRFSTRDTGLEPSKSGVIGMLCAALGRPRGAAITDLAALRMGVRADREGTMDVDFHTAGGWHRQRDRSYGVPDPEGKRPRTVLSKRYYLADADFLVALEGDPELLQEINVALARPRWQIYLGRKSFVPSAPVYLPDASPWGPGLREGTIEDALTDFPWLGDFEVRRRREPPSLLRIVLDASEAEATDVRGDVPVSFGERRFISRFVRTDFVPTRRLHEEG